MRPRIKGDDAGWVATHVDAANGPSSSSPGAPAHSSRASAPDDDDLPTMDADAGDGVGGLGRSLEAALNLGPAGPATSGALFAEKGDRGVSGAAASASGGGGDDGDEDVPDMDAFGDLDGGIEDPAVLPPQSAILPGGKDGPGKGGAGDGDSGYMVSRGTFLGPAGGPAVLKPGL